MYERIYSAYERLSKGDRAELKRATLEKLMATVAYFRILKLSGCKDTAQVGRIVYLITHADIVDEGGVNVATALINAGVNVRNIQQIVRSGDNSLDYFKRQLVRCKTVNLKSVGELAQYWGDNARRNLMKEFILNQND
jgi:CRISPR system Cascade subunit CasB